MSALVSVVVPVHNVAEYLDECLTSIADQTLDDLEVVVVDDGSTDRSAEIARRHAAGDPRFTVISQSGQGPGPARDAGVRVASGRYLAFADGDDIVPRDAYTRLVRSLERSGSDVAIGNAHRFDGTRRWQSWLHTDVCSAPGRRVHLRDRPELVRDRTVWNKVYRRAFWDEHKLSFPTGLYEDSPVALGAHAAASTVDVLDDVVYLWRKRPGSITEDRFELDNFTQRVTTALSVRSMLAERAPSAVAAYDERVLVDVEVRVVLEGLARVADDDRLPLIELAADALERVDAKVLRGLPALTRLQLHLLRHRMVPELLEVRRFIRLGEHRRADVVRRGALRGRWFARYPFFEDAEVGVPASVYDVTDELKAYARVDTAEWTDAGRLRIEGHAYIQSVGAAEPGDSRISVFLLADDKIGLKRVPITRVRRPDVTAQSGQPAVSYDWSGFVAEIDPERLRVLGLRRDVGWRFVVQVSAGGVRRRRSVGVPRSAREKWPRHRTLPGGTRAQSLASGAYRLRLRRPTAVVTAHRVEDGNLVVEGTLERRPDGATTVVASAPKVGVRVKADASLTDLPDGGARFTARLPLGELGSRDAVPVPGHEVEDSTTFSIELGDGTKLLMGDGVDDSPYAVEHPGGGDRRDPVEFLITRTRFDHLCGVARAALLTVTQARWDGEQLRLGGVWSGGKDTRPNTLLLRRHRSGHRQRIDIEWDDDRFHAAFAPGAIPVHGDPLPLSRGQWNLFAEGEGREHRVTVARGAIADLPPERVLATHAVELNVLTGDSLQLRVRLALPDDERGGFAQRRLQTVDYPGHRSEPIGDLAVFDSFAGRQYSDNPRGVFEELRRRDTGMECVWVSADGQFAPPDGARTVLSGSREHYEALARARLVVGNWRQQPWFDKRDGQTYVQCWHGTPLKKVGYDLKAMPYKRTEGVDWMSYDVPQWDLLMSQSPAATPFLRSAFDYRGDVIDTGYPRNDLLNRPDRDEIAARVRQRLGLPEGKKVVLYAPTWRDDFHFAVGTRAFQLELDLNAAASALGDDHVLLLRTHYLVTDRPAPGENPFVIDVTDYPDIAELFLVTDVFVTDYSSSMFDFAVTGKPMLFYTYDLDRYRDHVRGFYFDLAEAAPAPLLMTSDDVVDAVRDIDAIAADGADRYAAFRTRFCPHDDGAAAARLLDRVL